MPLTKKRLFERKYNQSTIISKLIGKYFNKPICNFSLIRVKHTNPQVKLPLQARLNNLKGAFMVKDNSKIKDARIILIDDVMTTGSTAANCAKVLVEAGAKEVGVLVLARAIKK